MPGEYSLPLSGFHIPNSDRFVETPASQRFTAGVPSQSSCRTCVTTQYLVGRTNDIGSNGNTANDHDPAAGTQKPLIHLHGLLCSIASYQLEVTGAAHPFGVLRLLKLARFATLRIRIAGICTYVWPFCLEAHAAFVINSL